MKKAVDWKLLHETDRSDVDKLFAIYKDNPTEAKVIFEMDKKKFAYERTVIFHRGEYFRMVYFHVSVGISSSNRIYTKKKVIRCLSYSEKGFYLETRHNGGNKSIKQLSFTGVSEFVSNVFGNQVHVMSIDDITNNRFSQNVVWSILLKRFSWIQFLGEHSMLLSTPFNYIVRHKLYSTNKALRHLFKAPLPCIHLLNQKFNDFDRPARFKIWKEIKRVLINLDAMRSEMIFDPLFLDTCRFANMLNKKINCSWSLKRMKTEHDKWSREITQIVLKHDPLRELKVNRLFLAFADRTGYHILTTNHELIAEGMKMNHCVGTYSDFVDNGESGIYHIDDYTLELRTHKDKRGISLYMRQMYGQSNTPPPMTLWNEVKGHVEAFNNTLGVRTPFEEETIWMF